jgi:hypothetical protein
MNNGSNYKVVTGGGKLKKKVENLIKEVDELKAKVASAINGNGNGATAVATGAPVAPGATDVANDRFGIPVATYRQGFLNVVARSNIAYPASAEEKKTAIANALTEVMGMPNLAQYTSFNTNFSPNPSNGHLNYKNGFLNVISRYNIASNTSNSMKRMMFGNKSSSGEIEKVRETRIKTALNEVQAKNNAGPQGLGSYTMEAFKDAAANYGTYAMNGFKNTTQGGRRNRRNRSTRRNIKSRTRRNMKSRRSRTGKNRK